MTPEAFILERKYLKNVTHKTLLWYHDAFRAFEGSIASRSTVVGRIAELRQRGVKAVSVNSWLTCINAYFNWLNKEHGQALVKIPKLKIENKVLATFSADHISRLIQWKPVRQSESRLKTLALTAVDTGLRVDELLSIVRPNVNLDDLTLLVRGKGDKQRRVPFSLELRKVLYKHLASHDNDLVFCTKLGGRLSQRNVLRDFKIACKRLKIENVRTSFHTLRHSFAIAYLRAGGNLFYLSRILGHTTLKTTERYLLRLGVEDLQAVHSKFSPLSNSR